MSKQIKTNTENINYYSEAIKVAENKDFIDFLRWFNGGDNLLAIRNSGYYDFYNNILKSKIFDYTKYCSSELTALEIGCGGGRILNAACNYFGNTIGIDIHDSFISLEKFLKLENNNFELYKVKENKIPTTDSSVDFVYSFIVLQHVLKISTFEDYVAETQRILKPNALAIIYFGRPRFLSKKIFQNRIFNYLALLCDKIFYEKIYLNSIKKGYLEIYNAQVNHVNLMVSIKKAKKIFEQNCLKILEIGYSKSRNYWGTQYFFIVKK